MAKPLAWPTARDRTDVQLTARNANFQPCRSTIYSSITSPKPKSANAKARTGGRTASCTSLRGGRATAYRAKSEKRSSRNVRHGKHGGVPWNQLPEGTRIQYQRLYHRRMQEYLDNGYGSCVLKQTEPRRIMIEALMHFHRTRYTLGSYAIAGNHVHVLVAPVPGMDLSDVPHTWKSFTAHAINKALGRTGQLWRPEGYDGVLVIHRQAKVHRCNRARPTTGIFTGCPVHCNAHF